MRNLLIVLLIFCSWKNGRVSPGGVMAPFGSHDWIALRGLDLAEKTGSVFWLRVELTSYLRGTEAPDIGATREFAASDYKDAIRCHCVLFSADGDVVKERAVSRVKQEYGRALAAGTAREAAYRLGAAAHYLGDLSQFMHLMGKESHWGSEDQKLHATYETAVEKQIDAKGMSLPVFEGAITPIDFKASSPGEIALEVALYTETGGGALDPAEMYFAWMKVSPAHRLRYNDWPLDLQRQTARNINAAVNGIARLLILAADARGR